jgi:hypothetical protein
MMALPTREGSRTSASSTSHAPPGNPRQVRGGPQGEAGLADAAGPDQAHHPRRPQLSPQLCQLEPPPDEARRFDWQVAQAADWLCHRETASYYPRGRRARSAGIR